MYNQKQPVKGDNSQAKRELLERLAREPKGDLKRTLGRIVKAGEQVEASNNGKAWWDNYLEMYKNHEFSRT